jgi:hypothetical protein
MEPAEKKKEAENDELKKKWEHKTKEINSKITKTLGDRFTDEQLQKVCTQIAIGRCSQMHQ